MTSENKCNRRNKDKDTFFALTKQCIVYFSLSLSLSLYQYVCVCLSLCVSVCLDYLSICLRNIQTLRLMYKKVKKIENER